MIEVKAGAWPYQVKIPIDPDATLGYGIDWTDWMPDGANASDLSAVWTVENGAIAAQLVVAGVAYCWLTPTVRDGSLSAACRVTLAASPVDLVDERTLILTISDR